MTDWYGREGARLGEDLRRDQAEAVRDGELEVDGGIRDREDRRHDFRESLRQILEVRSSILCGICGDEEIDLSPADDVDEALEIWDDHVRDVHDDHGGEPVPIADGGEDPLEDVEPGTLLQAGTTGWRYEVVRIWDGIVYARGPRGNEVAVTEESLELGLSRELDEGGIAIVDEPDLGVAATGYVCQNFPAHPGEEIDMISGPYNGVACPECGRHAGGPDDEIPFSDEGLSPSEELDAEAIVEELSESDHGHAVVSPPPEDEVDEEGSR